MPTAVDVDEYDEFFEDMNWEEVGKLLDAPSQPRAPTALAPTTSQIASTSRPSVVRQPPVYKPPRRQTNRNQSRSTPSLPSPWERPAIKRARSPDVVSGEESVKKMKMYAQKVLKEFEEDFTCPICFDLIVACHLANPCGHSACGECSTKWSQRKCKPTCFACRAPMNKTTPFIPGLIVDNLIEKQISSLAENGDEEWQEQGPKKKEWEQRKSAWTKQKSESKVRVQRVNTIQRAMMMNVRPEVVTISDESSEEETEDFVQAYDDPTPIRQAPVVTVWRDIEDMLRRPRVTRHMLQTPRDEDYVPTQLPGEVEAVAEHPAVRETRRIHR
ncbi:hypothetical protein DACRYDRAFT_116947 [Dacryopinax primogenitus]|uniref:RING-type domain-containing protein n=1 Tax=Dacryopinax primogenitus (strain DJM 731) TaxID=1858805 RepID=M5FXE5_DACPD|nr:uncharacterized protein DACRYDRAFT_116947 [Dacryopinax primogenitus]EJU01139.1 hypothetical protein DACRYDRAFT_116947 [Dacryopinax primogenitus]